MKWTDELLKAAMPYLIAIVVAALTYILGYLKDRWNLPKSITQFLKDDRVMEVIQNGILEGAELVGKTDVERREYVRDWAQKQIQILFGITIPDSTLNFLIEKVLADRRAK